MSVYAAPGGSVSDYKPPAGGILTPAFIGAGAGTSLDNATGATWSHTVPAGRKRALIVSIANSDNGAGTVLPTSVTYNGTPMIQLVQANSGNATARVSSFYYLVLGDGAAITANVVLAITGSANNSAACSSAAYANVNQTTFCRTPNQQTVTSALTVTANFASTKATDLDVILIATRNFSPTPNAPLTLRGAVQADSTFTYGAIADASASGGLDVRGWTIGTADTMAMTGVALIGA